MFPVAISGPRLALRELTVADADPLHALLSDARVADRVLDEAPPSLAQVREIIPRREGRFRDHLLVRGVWWDSVSYAILATDRRSTGTSARADHTA